MHKLTDKELIEELRIRISEKNNAVDELRMLNDRLKQVNMKLEESESLKSHFISNITNEIVNPFSSILGLSRNILSVDKENWKKVLSMVAMIHTEAFSLDFQLKNIFAAARIEAGEVFPEVAKVNIVRLTRDVIDSFRIEAQKRKISFDLSYEAYSENQKISAFRTDPEKLKLILSNLLNNALKFSYDETSVRTEIRITDVSLIITISNMGAEISDSHKQIIFDRFRRVDADISSVQRGHGLGLSIVRSLLDIINGEIIFSSDPLNGTVFQIKLNELAEEDNSFISTLNGNDLIFEDNQVF